ncbi:uncharacterized protein [Rutidosis leptorrhynchoides]|uniref:uncharacterized protein n=1 Tax=Rutidosis leptorrhynchoides TaxID=125765 RepID=UPI003A9900AE
MSTKKSSRKCNVKNKKERLSPEKSMSFHGQATDESIGTLRRPRTVPDLVSGIVTSPTETLRPKLTKLLINVTVQRSLGPVQVLISPESTVGDLISDALQQYLKEGRRPILLSFDPSCFGLHYSQFSLESLDPDEKLIELGSRSFFLCPKQIGVTMTSAPASASSSTCSKEVERVGWFRFMDNFLK